MKRECRAGRAIADQDLAVFFDGEGVGLGSIRQGFDARTVTTVGSHELQLRWWNHSQTFAVHFPEPGNYEAELRWNMFWAKFRRVAVIPKIKVILIAI